MFNKNTKLSIACLLMVAGSAHSVYAQPSTFFNSANESKANKVSNPFSRYGHGALNDNKNIIGRAIGGAVTGYNNPFSVNNYNPATYSFLKRVIFDLGVEANSSTFNINNTNYKSNTFTISYLSFGIPIGKNAGLSFGYRPTSNMYYDALDSTNIPGIGNVLRIYNGQGIINNAYLGFSYKIKGFSLGVNASYNFGNLKYSSAVENNDSLQIANTEFATYNYINGFDWKIGAIYQHIFNKDHYINFAATYRLGRKLNVERDAYAMSYKYNLDNEGNVIINPVDTIAALTKLGQTGTLDLPSEFSAGIHVGKSAEWNIGIDYVRSNYSTYSYFNDRSYIADKSDRYSFGAEFTPNIDADKNKFFLHSSLKGGAYFGTDYILINNQPLKYYGFTLGVKTRYYSPLNFHF